MLTGSLPQDSTTRFPNEEQTQISETLTNFPEKTDLESSPLSPKP